MVKEREGGREGGEEERMRPALCVLACYAQCLHSALPQALQLPHLESLYCTLQGPTNECFDYIPPTIHSSSYHAVFCHTQLPNRTLLYYTVHNVMFNFPSCDVGCSVFLTQTAWAPLVILYLYQEDTVFLLSLRDPFLDHTFLLLYCTPLWNWCPLPGVLTIWELWSAKLSFVGTLAELTEISWMSFEVYSCPFCIMFAAQFWFLCLIFYLQLITECKFLEEVMKCIRPS